MALTAEARNRVFIATTDKAIGKEICDAIDSSAQNTDISQFHDSTSAGLFATRSPGQTPAPVVYGATIGAVYTVNVSEGFRTFKISPNYANSPTFHIHWTKNSDVNDIGHNVLWRISYTVTDGSSQDINTTPLTIDLPDTYDSSGTTTRIVHRTANVPLVGVVAGWYVSAKIEAVTPTAPALTAAPMLVSCDLRYNMYINR